MNTDEKIKELKDGFARLSEDGKERVLAVARALLFAQDHFTKTPANSESGKKPA